MPTAARRKRFTNDPVLNAAGKPRAIPPILLGQPQHRLAREILKTLAYDRFLSADYIALLTGTAYSWASDLCAVLSSAPHPYIKACDAQAETRVLYLYTKDQYELSDLGRQAVLDHFGITVPPRNERVAHIEHQIMASHAMASFRIGALQSNGRFVILTQDDLINHRDKDGNYTMPEVARYADHPEVIPLGDKIENDRGKLVEHVIRPDNEIFVIRDLELCRAYFLPGFEIGRGTERIDAPVDKQNKKRHDHSFMECKFEDYAGVLISMLYRARFNAPNCYPLFIEPTVHRFTAKMFDTFARVVPPELRRFFLFKTHHQFTEKYTASGRMLTEPFLTVGENGRTIEFQLVQ